MKNSSRLLPQIAAYFRRSMGGLRGSRASASTRSLNASQDSSRFRYRLPVFATVLSLVILLVGLISYQRLSVRVLLDKRDDVLTVQRGSFVDESGGSYAYVVNGGLAVKTPIRVGASSIDKVEILDGLKEGDRIVISGTDSFKGAAKVAISN